MPRGRARAFGIDDSGLAAIEFAFVLPLMLAIYLGIVELSSGLSGLAQGRSRRSCDVRSDRADHRRGRGLGPGRDHRRGNAADIFWRRGVDRASVATPLTITISEVLITQNASGAYQAQVTWSVSYNGGTLRNGQGCTLNTYLNAADVPPVSAISMPPVSPMRRLVDARSGDRRRRDL